MDGLSSSVRSVDAMRASFGESQQGLAGIGLLMQQDGGSQSTVYIKNIVPGGACHRDGSIQVGDAVVAVNGENVVGYPVADIRERIVGPIGSAVRVEFGRDGQTFERTLTRGNAQMMESQSQQQTTTTTTMHMQHVSAANLSRSLDARGQSSFVSMDASETARMRSRISELENELGMARDELMRMRGLLEGDKMSSMRYVKEIDSVQRKNTEQVMELQQMLNQSEQARRELEIQVQTSKAREEEFHSAFSRAKEQTEAREQYFADLKRKFNDLQLNFDRDVNREREAKKDAEKAREEANANVERMRTELERFKDLERTRREKEEGIRKLLHESEARLIEAKQIEEKVRSQGQQLHLLFGQWQKDFFVNKSREEAELEQYFLA